MAWTNIDDSFLEPGKPVRSADLIALRDNAVAVAEGSVGAPSLNLGIAARGIAGAVGTYAFASRSSGQYSFGALISGSLLTPASAQISTGGTLSGTWRCMGAAGFGTAIPDKITLWLRIS